MRRRDTRNHPFKIRMIKVAWTGKQKRRRSEQECTAQAINNGPLGPVRQPNLRNICETQVLWNNNLLDFSSVCVEWQSSQRRRKGDADHCGGFYIDRACHFQSSKTGNRERESGSWFRPRVDERFTNGDWLTQVWPGRIHTIEPSLRLHGLVPCMVEHTPYPIPPHQKKTPKKRVSRSSTGGRQGAQFVNRIKQSWSERTGAWCPPLVFRLKAPGAQTMQDRITIHAIRMENIVCMWGLIIFLCEETDWGILSTWMWYFCADEDLILGWEKILAGPDQQAHTHSPHHLLTYRLFFCQETFSWWSYGSLKFEVNKVTSPMS